MGQLSFPNMEGPMGTITTRDMMEGGGLQRNKSKAAVRVDE